MKKNLLAVFAIVLAIAFSAFTTKSSIAPKSKNFLDPKYYIHNSTDVNQRDADDYIKTTTVQSECELSSVLCWVKVTDVVAPTGTIDDADFLSIFDGLDTDHDNTLNDQTENGTTFEKKN